MLSIKENVESRLNVAVPDGGNIVTTSDLDQFIQDGVAEIYRALTRQGAMDQLRLFVKKTEEPALIGITGATAADPVVFTSSQPHNLASGHYIKITKMTQMTDLMETILKVDTTPTATTFTCHFINNAGGTAETGGGEFYQLDVVTNYGTNPIQGLNDKFFDTDYVLVERKESEVNSSLAEIDDLGPLANVWYACKEVSIDNVHKVKDPTSVEYATARTPVYWKNEIGEITIYPDISKQSPGRIWGLDHFRDLLNTSVQGTYKNYPDSYFLALVYYVTAEAASNYVSNNTKTLMTTAYSDPTVVTRLADSPPAIPYGLAGIVGSPPTFTKPTVTPDAARLNAFLDDDDSELAAVAVQKYSQEIQQYAQDIQNELAEYTKEAKVWETNVQHQFKDADGDLQALIGQYQNEVQRYQTNVQAYSAEVQNQGNKIQNLIQKYSGQITAFTNIAGLYQSKFTAYMTTKMPKAAPEQKKGGRSAS